MVKIAIILTASVLVALTAIASQAQISARSQINGPLASCQSQIWPNFSNGCLLTIDGEKSQRKFRVVKF